MISKYLFVISIATFKFLFSQGVAAAMGLSFLEVFLLTSAGACVSATFFYWLAEHFNELSKRKRKKKAKKLIAQGLHPIHKKDFTRVNKIIVKGKTKIGFYGIATLTPLFLSVPIGSIIVAKFYGRFSWSFYYILLVIILYAFFMTTLIFLFL